MHTVGTIRGVLLGTTFSLGILLAGSTILAQVHPPEPPLRALGSLRNFAPPLPDIRPYLNPNPAGGGGIAAAERWLEILGKSLFWDQQAGSDGQACASCHFHAGADIRRTNILTPGIPDKRFPTGDVAFGGLNNPNDITSPASNGLTAGGHPAGPNVTLQPEDFPFHVLSDVNNPQSTIIYTTNDTASSPGVRFGQFISDVPNSPFGDRCNRGEDDVFFILHPTSGAKLDVRRVEPRQTPTMINAVFNFANFWDGRANNRFNGSNPFGNRAHVDPSVGIVVGPIASGTTKVTPISLENSSLASQSVGPPLSEFEASCAGRSFADLGRKMLARRGLSTQQVHQNDSVLGAVRHFTTLGLQFTYDQLIQRAFAPNLWNANGRFLVNSGSGTVTSSALGFTQKELNFSFFWGLAVQAYEATLISDNAPFDAFCGNATCTAGNPNALTAQEQLGLKVFTGSGIAEGITDGRCVNCHDGPEFTKAATHLQPENEEEGLVERMLMANQNGGPALYDNGFYNIGVTPTAQDVGRGGLDPFGNPLSFTRQFVNNNFVDPIQVDPNTFEIPFEGPPDLANERLAVDGSFKTAGLRNVGLTAPYFHNGGVATLEQVVEFYNRGGNERGGNNNNSTGSGPLGRGPIPATPNNQRGTNLDPDIQNLNLTQEEQDALVAFLLALTDQDVACERAPFDHPQLRVVRGHKTQDANGDGMADDDIFLLAAVGAGGLPAVNPPRPCHPNTGNLFDMGALIGLPQLP